MKIIFIVLLIFFSNHILANEEDNNEVEVINLYENKSLDQMVLENLNDKKESENVFDDLNESNDLEIKNSEIDENEKTKIEVSQIEIAKDNFVIKHNIGDLKNYFNNLQKINSKTLQEEIIEVFDSLQLDIENDQDYEIFFLIVNYFKSVGQINNCLLYTSPSPRD